ncbi:MAG: transposase [Thermodesulfovibrionales bacterium]|nr:transposase [Thermodesulfovibrionales bacterium]
MRIEFPGALYHITSRGNERKSIFLDDADRLRFLEILKDYHDRYSILIHSFVLMDNHYHLILETPKGNLLKVMHGINGRYTGYFNRKYERSGHLFQGRYKGILVEKDTYLLQLSRYVHMNPARAKIVKKPEQYRWSSYPAYIGKDKEYKWVEYSWILSNFEKEGKSAKNKYRKYVEESFNKDMEDPAKNLYGQLILGRDEFIEKIRGMFSGKCISKEIVERKRLLKSPTPEDIIEKVAEAFGVDRDLINEKNIRGNVARKAAIYLVQRYCNLRNDEISKIFGDLHCSAISKVSTRFKEELAKNKALAKIIRRLESIVKT